MPGCYAKPIVDILVGARDGSHPDSTTLAALRELGYEFLGENKLGGERWKFRKQGAAPFNLSIVPLDSELWRDNFALRDFLRAHPEEVEAYGEIKRKVAAAHPDSLLDYQRSKRPYVEALLVRARQWSETT